MAAQPASRAARQRPGFPALVALTLVAAGLGLLPWMIYLAVSLPTHPVAWHWPAAWVGLDGMEAAGLISTGYLMLRHDARCCLAAMAAAALLVADAWFDVTTAPPGAGIAEPAALALLTELPTAAACLTLAVRGLSRVLTVRAAVELYLGALRQPVGSAPCGYLSSARAAVSTRSPGRCHSTPR